LFCTKFEDSFIFKTSPVSGATDRPLKIKSVSINNQNSSNEVVINVSKPGNSVGNEKSTNGSIIKIKDTKYTANIRYQIFWSKKIVL
jgi:hypothetical protein